jgi:hypothetical protein
MPRDVFMDLKKVRVCGQAIKITAVGKTMEPQKKRKPKFSKDERPGAKQTDKPNAAKSDTLHVKSKGKPGAAKGDKTRAKPKGKPNAAKGGKSAFAKPKKTPRKGAF